MSLAQGADAAEQTLGGASVPVENSVHNVSSGQNAHKESTKESENAKVHISRLNSEIINLEQGYDAFLRALRSKMPELPDVKISFNDLSYVVDVPDSHHDVPNVAKATATTFYNLLPTTWVAKAFGKGRAKSHRFDILKNCTGEIKPGRMTLLLAPPGHGKTAFLRAIAGRIPSKHLSGEVKYSGESKKGIRASLHKLIAYIDQVDTHMPELTVRETLQFAADASLAKTEHIDDPEVAKAYDRRVDMFLKILGLEECADTLVGSAIVRGVSGGQKKRVTIGEMMISNARVFLLDEISTGLDSAVTLDIMTSVQHWCRQTNGSVVAALLQPPPDVYDLFDDILLLREGQVVYHGPRTHALQFVERLGFVKPSHVDAADFLTDVLADPKGVYKLQIQGGSSPTPGGQPSTVSEDDQKILDTLDTEHMVEAWQTFQKDVLSSAPASRVASASEFNGAHELVKHAEESIQTSTSVRYEKGMDLSHPYAFAQYGKPYARSVLALTKLCLKRDAMLLLRNPRVLIARFGEAVFIALVLGSLFFNLGLDEFGLKFGVLMFAAMFLGFSNMAEVPIAIEQRNVVHKQNSAGFYPTISYSLSVIITHIPMAVIESVLMGTILYWMTGLAEDAGRFFFFLLTIFITALVMGVMFRSLAYASPNMETAQVMTGPSIGMMVLFGGFLATRETIPIWLRWIYWISPFSWITRTLLQNEFFADKYDFQVPGKGLTYGELGLNTFEIQSDAAFKWGGIGYLIGIYIVLMIFMSLLVENRRFEVNIGTSRHADTEDEEEVAIEDDTVGATATAQPDDKEESEAHAALPFQPMTLAFNDIKYWVTLADKSEKQLLRGVSAMAQPGTMTALMGASGAGKTTLMDVIAGRKTAGRIEGDILVNGRPKETRSFARSAGYVEQQDLHMPFATVREAVQDAAILRLPADVNAEDRNRLVEHTLKVLELDTIAERMVGTPGENDGGLAPGQRKRLTIAVELVANPSILFLDEPTSGLDSRAALTVMRVVRRIARSGRTIVCTIHQPSAEIFYSFDRLLLLASGGYQVFAGDIGERGALLKDYFESQGASPCPSIANPADWMLEQLGVGALGRRNNNSSSTMIQVDNVSDLKKDGQLDDKVTANSEQSSGSDSINKGGPAIDFVAVFEKSDRKVQNDRDVEEASAPRGQAPVEYDSIYARSHGTQFAVLFERFSKSYWRNSPYNFTRLFVTTTQCLLFGVVFYDIRNEATDVARMQSMFSYIFLLCLFGGMINYSTCLPVMQKARAVYYRELASNMYASQMYSAAQCLIEVPFVLVVTLCSVVIGYFMGSFEASAGVFFHHVFIQFFFALAFNYLGMFFVSLLPNVEVAQVIGSLIITMFFLFGGLFVPGPDIPDGWIWMHYINPVTYGVNAIASLQVHCYEEDKSQCPTITLTNADGTETVVSREQYAADTYDTNYDDRWLNTGIVIVFTALFALGTILVLRYVNHAKR